MKCRSIFMARVYELLRCFSEDMIQSMKFYLSEEMIHRVPCDVTATPAEAESAGCGARGAEGACQADAEH